MSGLVAHATPDKRLRRINKNLRFPAAGQTVSVSPDWRLRRIGISKIRRIFAKGACQRPFDIYIDGEALPGLLGWRNQDESNM